MSATAGKFFNSDEGQCQFSVKSDGDTCLWFDRQEMEAHGYKAGMHFKYWVGQIMGRRGTFVTLIKVRQKRSRRNHVATLQPANNQLLLELQSSGGKRRRLEPTPAVSMIFADDGSIEIEPAMGWMAPVELYAQGHETRVDDEPDLEEPGTETEEAFDDKPEEDNAPPEIPEGRSLTGALKHFLDVLERNQWHVPAGQRLELRDAIAELQAARKKSPISLTNDTLYKMVFDTLQDASKS